MKSKEVKEVKEAKGPIVSLARLGDCATLAAHLLGEPAERETAAVAHLRRILTADDLRRLALVPESASRWRRVMERLEAIAGLSRGSITIGGSPRVDSRTPNYSTDLARFGKYLGVRVEGWEGKAFILEPVKRGGA